MTDQTTIDRIRREAEELGVHVFYDERHNVWDTEDRRIDWRERNNEYYHLHDITSEQMLGHLAYLRKKHTGEIGELNELGHCPRCGSREHVRLGSVAIEVDNPETGRIHRVQFGKGASKVLNFHEQGGTENDFLNFSSICTACNYGWYVELQFGNTRAAFFSKLQAKQVRDDYDDLPIMTGSDAGRLGWSEEDLRRKQNSTITVQVPEEPQAYARVVMSPENEGGKKT